MKQTILLSIAAVVGAAAIAISQPTASDPTSAATPAPGAASFTSGSEQQATTSTTGAPDTKVAPTSSDAGKTCGYGASEGARGKFRGHGNWRDRHHSERSMEKKLDRLLNLSDEQRQKVKEIIQANEPKIKAIREEQWAKVRAVRDETRQQIRTLLTPAQQKVLDDANHLREQAWKLKHDSRRLHQESDDQS
jgi:hypothetical protein